MTSPAYRACVGALERLLSPRVVSRTLRMAMEPAGLTPETVASDDLEPILKGPVFQQLQVAMPPDRAREKIREILAALPREAAPEGDGTVPDASPDGASGGASGAEGGTPAEVGPSHDRSGTDDAPVPIAPADGSAVGDDRRDGPDAPEGAVADGEHAELARLQDALRPFNLYFEWPEVRRLRAQLVRIEEEVSAGGAPEALIEEADETLRAVRQKLEDRLVLQAQELAVLEEALEEVSGLGGPKVRRLASLVKRVRDAQDHRQLADAEIERGSGLARDLRKLMASSVYQEAGEGDSPDLEARLKALDVAGEVEELDRLARDRAVLLEHRSDLAERVATTRDQVASGLTLGGELDVLRELLTTALSDRVGEVRAELAETAERLDEAPDAWSDDLRREHEVLVDMLDDGLPPLADLVHFRDRVALALRRAERADRFAEDDAAAARASLDAQGDRLRRAREQLLRYGDDADDDAVERLRTAVEALRIAQAEERLDPDADADLRDAAEALALARQEHGPPEDASRAQIQVLLSRLDGLPTTIDPAGAAELRADLVSWRDDPPNEESLASASAAVAEAVAAAREACRRRLDRLGSEAGRWGFADLLDATRDANERLEDERDPGLAALERRLEAALEDARTAQLERLHRLEREAERLSGIDAAQEAELTDALAHARDAVAEGAPAGTLDVAEALVGRLAATLEQRADGFVPRLDVALVAFTAVERLNSDDVTTVRRILRHLDSQRDAFERVSPSLRARMERSLQEAEELLDKLAEEERATRAIADQLMAGNRFDDVLGLFGEPSGGTPRDAGPTDRGGADEGGDGEGGDGDDEDDDGNDRARDAR